MENDPSTSRPVTLLLQQWRSGDPEAREKLVTLVYPHFRSLAARYMSGESGAHTLTPTALVHEAYLKLLGSHVEWDDRVHFYAVAARVMRHILVDHAKSKRREKRGGGAAKISLDDVVVVSSSPADELTDLDEALQNLAKIDQRKADIVELLYFGGLSQQEAAATLGISESTVQRELRLAKAWLYRELNQREDGAGEHE
jgi:RNA polymerase sigma factor (TIGR02999 family)